MPGIAADGFVSVDEADAGTGSLQQESEFPRVILAVAVGVKDVGLRGSKEAGPQRRAIAEVSLMRDDAEERLVRLLETR